MTPSDLNEFFGRRFDSLESRLDRIEEAQDAMARAMALAEGEAVARREAARVLAEAARTLVATPNRSGNTAWDLAQRWGPWIVTLAILLGSAAVQSCQRSGGLTAAEAQRLELVLRQAQQTRPAATPRPPQVDGGIR